MTTTPNSTVSAASAMEALERIKTKGDPEDAWYKFGKWEDDLQTIMSFIAQHSDASCGASSTEPVAARWWLLEVGEVICEGDEVFNTETQEWEPLVQRDFGQTICVDDNPIRRRFAAQGQSDVIELRICEQSHLLLRPNQLYRFTVAPDCAQCKETAAIYEQRPTGGGG